MNKKELIEKIIEAQKQCASEYQALIQLQFEVMLNNVHELIEIDESDSDELWDICPIIWIGNKSYQTRVGGDNRDTMICPNSQKRW